ncbi:MAG: glycosyltransferase [Deltaproteobacteria bacterium]|nr:glycosyltransferase [Deltaproteobacteria bacterium]
MHIGILTDYPTPSFMSGPAIHTRFLTEKLRERGHEVTLMGPDTTDVVPTDGDEPTVLFKGFGFPTHPDVKIVLPWPPRHFSSPPRVDLIHGQTAQHLMYYGAWMRQMYRIPVVATNTVFMPVYSGHVLSDRLHAWKPARDWARGFAETTVDVSFAKVYNDVDTLIVQNRFLVDYWRDKGVTSTIRVVGRPIDPRKFDGPAGPDPFPAHFVRGKRMLVVCRQDREKALDQIIRVFGTRIAPRDPEFSLTLVGKGHYQDVLMRMAEESGYADRIWFPGEVPHQEVADWFRNADIFPYAAIFETFGNVINEAFWCGLPVVALDDRMGVAHQVEHGFNGFLVPPDRPETDETFARYCLELGRNDAMRRRLGENARRRARQVSHPDTIVRQFEEIYDEARENCFSQVPAPLAEAGGARRLHALVTRIGPWAKYNYMLLGLAGVATRVTGLRGRKAPVKLDDARTRRPAPAPVSILRGGTAGVRGEPAERSRAVARRRRRDPRAL